MENKPRSSQVFRAGLYNALWNAKAHWGGLLSGVKATGVGSMAANLGHKTDKDSSTMEVVERKRAKRVSEWRAEPLSIPAPARKNGDFCDFFPARLRNRRANVG